MHCRFSWFLRTSDFVPWHSTTVEIAPEEVWMLTNVDLKKRAPGTRFCSVTLWWTNIAMENYHFWWEKSTINGQNEERTRVQYEFEFECEARVWERFSFPAPNQTSARFQFADICVLFFHVPSGSTCSMGPLRLGPQNFKTMDGDLHWSANFKPLPKFAQSLDGPCFVPCRPSPIQHVKTGVHFTHHYVHYITPHDFTIVVTCMPYFSSNLSGWKISLTSIY